MNALPRPQDKNFIMIQLNDFGQAYLRLALEINKHIDGYIETFLGPTDFRARIEAEDKKSPQALLDDLARLREMIPVGDPIRYRYIEAILCAMDCSLRILNREEFEYFDEVHRLFDIRPRLVNEALFTKAHRELDSLLPGSGSVSNRLDAWRKLYEIPKDKLLDLVELAHRETRERTRAFVNLIEGEAVEMSLTSGQPWLAYSKYIGNAQSRIEFNIDVPFSALDLAELIAHEAYPGHHTEGQLKEKALFYGKGFAEHGILIMHSPAAVIAEGIAMTAAEIIFPGDTRYDWTAEVLLPAASLPHT